MATPLGPESLEFDPSQMTLVIFIRVGGEVSPSCLLGLSLTQLSLTACRCPRVAVSLSATACGLRSHLMQLHAGYGLT